MIIIDVSSWEEFEAKLKEETFRRPLKRYCPPIFRGECHSEWSLYTTLERNEKIGMEFIEYYRMISAMKSEVEVCANREWNIPEYGKVLNDLKGYDDFSLNQSFGRIPGYAYMAYLRHHGFPSPLLDWTASKYIAAYFAFNRAREDGRVAIYALYEHKMKSHSSSEPRIINLGPNVKTHRRHFLQQCEYTMCLSFTNETWCFEKHDGSLTRDDRETNFTILKFKIPSGEKLKVQGLLNQFNLNAFSLFGSEESLMETMAWKYLSK